MLEDGKDAWHRAITLTLQLNTGAGDRIYRIISSLFPKFQEADFDNTVYAIWLSDLLLKTYLDEVKSKSVVVKLEEFAHKAKEAQDYYRARRLSDLDEQSAMW